MKKAVIYARVSTDEQAREGQSIEVQIKLCRKYAENEELEIVDTFVDEGKSATNMRRPALQDMMELIQDKRSNIEVVLVQDTDRLARNTLDHLKIKALLKKNGAQLIAISQPLIDDSPEGNLIDTLLAATNAFQSQITGRKVSKVMEQKAENGWFPGGTPPLGYRNILNPAPSSNLDKKIIAIDDSVAPYIREVFNKYSDGQVSTAAMADYLNSVGVRSPMGGKINTSTMINTLKNSFYIGQFKWKDKVYDGKHETLIDEEIFKKVQMVMKSHNKGATRKRRHNFLLRGFLFYQDTKRQMWGDYHLKRGVEYRFYYCKTTGKGSYFSADELEDQVQEIFNSIEITEKYKNDIMATAKRLLKESQGLLNSERQRLNKEKLKFQKAISDAEDDRYVKKVITSDDFNRLSTKYKNNVKSIDRQLKDLDIDHSNRLKQLDRLVNLAENISQTYYASEDPLKREYLALFFEKFWVKDGKIIDYVLTDRVKDMIEEESVRVNQSMMPRMDSNHN